jgi:glycosyltransferase involved in cell wall biosynthesis
MGCRFIPLDMDSKGLSPMRDLVLLARFWRVFRQERPDAILGYTVKNNVYGALAARAAGIPFLPNVSGLGTAFLAQSWLQTLVKGLYRAAFAKVPVAFFQNQDDRALFVDANLVERVRTQVLPGSGIDLDHFRPAPMPQGMGVRFLLIGRMLKDKGVGEFVDAARIVKRTCPTAEFQLLGAAGAENRTAIEREVIDGWVREGVVEYLGTVEDVRPAIAAADCVVLPSYREGAPRTLIEAAAMARPVIATRVPGCTAVVEDGVTGLLCNVRDAEDLARKMHFFVDAGPAERSRMGAAGRGKMEREYDQELVITAYKGRLAAHAAAGYPA